MASDAEVCNLGLLLIGQTQFIDDLSDETEIAEVLSEVYERLREAALEAFAWPFATRRAALAEIANGARGAWGFAYVLPADCLAPRWIWNGTENPDDSAKVPWALEDDATAGRVLLTNQQDATLVYTRRVTESGKFSPLFVEALSAKIAFYLAMGVAKKPQLGLGLLRYFNSCVAQAAAAQFNQRQKDADPDSTFVTERG